MTDTRERAMLWWTVQHLVVTLALALLAWATCRVGRLGPAARHAVWLVVLIKLLTPAVVAWPWGVGDPLAGVSPPAGAAPAAGAVAVARDAPASPPPWPPERLPPPTAREFGLDLPEPRDGRTGAATPAAPPPATTAAPSKHRDGAPSSPGPRWRHLPAVLAVAGLVWIAGGLAFALLQVVRIARMSRLLRRARPVDPTVAEGVEKLSRRLDMRPIRTRHVPELASPVIWSLGRPQLLWPAGLSDAMSRDSAQALIVHELAHVKRRDHWIGWLELLAGCAWWWNPAFWWARRQLRHASELACDAWVVETLPGARRAYAEGLLAVCESMAPRPPGPPRAPRPAPPLPALGVSTGGRRFLERRLTMILRHRTALHVPRLGLLAIALIAVATLPAWPQKPPDGGGQSDRPEPPGLAIDPTGRTLWTNQGGLHGYGLVRRAPEPALPADARDLLQQFDQEQAAARREFEERLAGQRDQLVQRLLALQDRYTQAGQQQEAAAVAEHIRRMQARGRAGPAEPHGMAVAVALGRAQPDPGNLTGFRGRVGQAFLFDVVGRAGGPVWGSGVYTDDSMLAAAAVHAGVLRAGERGVVQVTILAGQDRYDSTTCNGITTSPYGAWDGSYRVEAAPAADRVRFLDVPGPKVDALPDPGTLESYRDRIGQSFTFAVVGRGDATIWGSGVYTDDSPLATAAVHAGAVGVGQRGVVRVTILPGRDQYEGATHNGVTSRPYGAFGGSYQVNPVVAARPAADAAPRVTVLPDLPALQSLRGRVGQTFAVELMGSTDGSVWGSDVYTDDSAPAVAAVHAGALADGERGRVHITILPGCETYAGTTRNGVTSYNWGTWQASFRIERAPAAEHRAPAAPGATTPRPTGAAPAARDDHDSRPRSALRWYLDLRAPAVPRPPAHDGPAHPGARP